MTSINLPEVMTFGSYDEVMAKLDAKPPSGTYHLVLKDWTYKESKDKHIPAVSLHWQIIEGDCEGKSLWDWLGWGYPDTKQRICTIAGRDSWPPDETFTLENVNSGQCAWLDSLIGTEVTADVIHKAPFSNITRYHNRQG
jgi:hypothetical protein